MAEENTIYSTVKPLVNEYHFYIDKEIKEPDPFYDMLTILREASPQDYIFLHFNSPGGNLHTALQLIDAIDNSPATVVGCADGDVSSAASALFFACHAFKINPASQFLIHSGNGGEIGKPADVLAGAEFYHKAIRDFLTSSYSRFLEEEELEDVLRGRELYLTGAEVEERINNVLEKEGEVEEDSDSDT